MRTGVCVCVCVLQLSSGYSTTVFINKGKTATDQTDYRGSDHPLDMSTSEQMIHIQSKQARVARAKISTYETHNLILVDPSAVSDST